MFERCTIKAQKTIGLIIMNVIWMTAMNDTNTQVLLMSTDLILCRVTGVTVN